jgi:Ice-binding-like
MRANILQAFRRSTVYSLLAVVLAAGLLPFTAMAVLASEAPRHLEAQARAVVAQVDLGTATAFSVLAGQSVTNTGPTVVSGDLGVSPGSSVTGFPPGTVLGTTHVADATAVTAQTDLTTAYNDAAGRTPTASRLG